MRGITYCYPYYENPGMLAKQYETWAAYPPQLQQCMEIVIVDDGSKKTPAIDIPIPVGVPALRIYRIEQDWPWNQHAARNIAAHEAAFPWLLMSDMDHEFPATSLARMLTKLNDEARIYKFRRYDAPDMKLKIKDGKEHPHPNTFALSREMYWRVGGYDERLCGVYGTDSLFRKMSERLTGMAWRQTDIAVVRYDRAVIADASTTQYERDAYRDGEKKKEISKLLGDGERPLVMTQEYEQVV